MGADDVAALGEFGLIADITRSLEMPDAVQVGPGDDGAVFRVKGASVVSVDALVEGVHFRRDWSSAIDVGRKTVAVSVADLEAMGADPVALVIALSVPGSLPASWVRDFATGVRTESEAAGITLVGGDTTRSRDITISATVIGQLAGRRAVTRSGARPGDVVAYIGRLGWAGAGLTVLTRGFRSPRAAVDSQRCPQVPYGQGAAASLAGATAMVDISDGLLADLGHICDASGVTIDLSREELPVDDPVRTVGAATNRDPLDFVLTGGEDHALVACFPVGSIAAGWQVIGRVHEPADPDAEDARPAARVTVDGVAWPDAGGWDHFR
ncbi:MAG TPA: thiamine-phosphate kinase [Propionibacteriaceae bacterium]|nr:thiamine-phosphate kinase [Propionibacteriaceae bacterium]